MTYCQITKKRIQFQNISKWKEWNIYICTEEATKYTSSLASVRQRLCSTEIPRQPRIKHLAIINHNSQLQITPSTPCVPMFLKRYPSRASWADIIPTLMYNWLTFEYTDRDFITGCAHWYLLAFLALHSAKSKRVDTKALLKRVNPMNVSTLSCPRRIWLKVENFQSWSVRQNLKVWIFNWTLSVPRVYWLSPVCLYYYCC